MCRGGTHLTIRQFPYAPRYIYVVDDDHEWCGIFSFRGGHNADRITSCRRTVVTRPISSRPTSELTCLPFTRFFSCSKRRDHLSQVLCFQPPRVIWMLHS